MRRKGALDSLMPRTRQDILAAAFIRPDTEFYAAELASKLGVPPSSLQRELKQLTSADILTSTVRGHMTFYRANKESPLFVDLRGLMLKTRGLVDVLTYALRPLIPKIEVAFVFGSIAAGNERSESDIDLMVVGSVRPMDLSLPLRRVRNEIGREINPSVYTGTEFRSKLGAGDHFLTHVMSEPRLTIVGSANDLGTTISG